MANQKGKKFVEKKIVTTPCRAVKGCEGRQASVVRAQNTPGGGRSILYRCTTCGKMFGLNY